MDRGMKLFHKICLSKIPNNADATDYAFSSPLLAFKKLSGYLLKDSRKLGEKGEYK